MAITPLQQQGVQTGIDEAKRLADLATRQEAADKTAGQKQIYQPQPVGTPTGAPLIATGTVTVPSTITAGAVAPTTPIDFKTPSPTPLESVADIETPKIPLTPIETQADALTQRLMSINESLLGKATFTREQQQAQGIPEKNQAIADLTQQFNDLKKKEAAIHLEYGGSLAANRGVLEPFVSGERDARLRQNAVQALTISSMIDASNGLLASAQRKVDLAVQQKYGAIEEELKIKLQNLEILSKSPGLTRAEKDRAAAQALALKKQEEETAQKKQEQKDIWTMTTTASQNIQNFKPTTEFSTSAQALQAGQNAKTKEDALRIFTSTGLTKPPVALSDFEQAFLRDKGRLPTVAELQASKATEKAPPSDIQSFKTFFPNVDLKTPAGQQQYLNWKAKEAAAGRAPTDADATVSPDVLKGMLNVYKATGVLPPFGLSAKSPLRAQFFAALGAEGGNEIVTDATVNKSVRAGLTTAFKTQQNQLAANQTAIKTLDRQLGLVQKYSDKVSRSNSPLVAKYVLWIKGIGAGDADTAVLNNITKTAAYEFAKILSGSAASIAGSTVSSVSDAENILNSAMSKGQFVETIKVMKQEAEFRLNSQKDTIKQLEEDMKNISELSDTVVTTPIDVAKLAKNKNISNSELQDSISKYGIDAVRKFLSGQ